MDFIHDGKSKLPKHCVKQHYHQNNNKNATRKKKKNK